MNTERRDSRTGRSRPENSQTTVLAWARVFDGRTLSILFFLALVMVSGVAVVNSTFKTRYTLNQLQQLRNEQNDLNVQWGQLLIEQSTFGLEGRIGRKAEEELGMRVPDWSRVTMVRYE
jgi:cell division protein FtsL